MGQFCRRRGRMNLVSLLNILLLSTFPFSGYGMPLECREGKSHNAPVWLKGPGHPVELVSPNYPLSSNITSVTCTWDVRAEWGSNIQVRVIEANMGSSCFSNKLEVYDDTTNPLLQFPGMKVQCGQSSFPPHTRTIVSEGIVTVRFTLEEKDENVKFKVLVEVTRPPP